MTTIRLRYLFKNQQIHVLFFLAVLFMNFIQTDFATAGIKTRISTPVSLKEADIDIDAFRYLLACNEKFKSYIGDYSRPIQNVVLADFSEPMEEPRLFIIQLDKNNPYKYSKVALRTWVSHGSGSGRVDFKTIKTSHRRTFAKNLTDLKATQTTPAGCFRIFGKGEAGVLRNFPNLKGFYISGLEQINECSHTKGIRLHEHPQFVNPRQNAKGEWLLETITNSSGCLRVDSREIDFLKNYIYPTSGNLLVIYPGTPRTNLNQIDERFGLRNYYKRTPMEYENEVLAYRGVHPHRTLINHRYLTKSMGRNCESYSKMSSLKPSELAQIIRVVPKQK